MEDKYWDLNQAQKAIYNRLTWAGDGALNNFTILSRSTEVAQKGLWNVSGTVRTIQDADDIANATWAAMYDYGYLTESQE